MKKLVLLSFALFSLGVSAQESSAGQTLPSKQTAESPYKPYSQLYVGYSPIFKSEGGYHKTGTETIHGGIIGWAYGLSLTRKCPLYLEFGFTLSFNGQKESIEYKYVDEEGVVRKAGELSSTYSLIRLGVPFNVSYRITVGNNVIIAPYAGFTWHFNPLNDITTKLEYTDDYKKTPEFASVSQYAPEQKQKIYYHHEIQASCQVGFKLTINKHILLGAEYCLGITDIADDTKSTHAAVNVGYEW
jgi:hypothetical protein